MKKTLLALLATAFVLVGCNKEEEIGFKFIDCYYSIKCGEQAKVASAKEPRLFGATKQQRLSVDSICRIKNLTIMCHPVDDYAETTKRIDSVDVVSHKFLESSRYVFSMPDGELVTSFISDFTDLVIVYPYLNQYNMWCWDTVGYIKNSERLETGARVLALYEQQKYDEIYAMFNALYTWYPCTGEEYRELRKRGEN